jgi:tetratricopeptide (TPR) repeat protein
MPRAPFLAGLVLGLGLLLPGVTPVLAAPDKPAGEPMPGEPEPPPELTDEEKAELFAPYEEAMATGQKAAAADSLLPILDDPEKGAAHGEAWVKLGELYRGFDMDYSALIAYAAAISVDPAVGATRVGEAIDLAEELGDTRLLAPILAKNVGLDVDLETRSRMAYLAARHNVQEGQYGVAMGMLALVGKKTPTFTEAQALKGVVMAQQGQYDAALAPLLTAQALGQKAEKGARFDNVVTLNVARTYFGAGNYPRAVEYYAKVERSSDFWEDAWFEKAWAHFRGQDITGALASLMVHESPFFRERYFNPEADMLRAYSYFLMCKFKDATAEIEAFEQRYRPLQDELAATMTSYDTDAGWEDALALTEGRETTLPEGVIREFRNDERLLGAIQAVQKADDELSRLANVSANVFASRAQQALRERRDAIRRDEGQRFVDAGADARDQLKGMLADVQITKLDMMQYETSQLERAARTGAIDEGDRIGQLRELRKTRGTRVWPFQGEYWADEVGYYQVRARPDCAEDARPATPDRRDGREGRNR